MENSALAALSVLENYPWKPQALFVLRSLNKAQHQAYLVGGVVRDALLNRPNNDYDVASSARPEELAKIFPEEQLHETGLRHGTYTLVQDGLAIEITSFRIDGTYSDGRRPDSVVFSRKIEDDLARRDFTVNAFAYSPYAGDEKFIDFFDGLADLQERQIRAVGDSKQRFNEDALRILRALRFAAELDFTIEAHTYQTCNAMAERLRGLAAERISSELWRLLAGNNLERLAKLCPEVWRQVLPDLAEMTGKDFQEQFASIDILDQASDLRLVWLLRDTKAVSLKHLRLSRKQLKAINDLRQYSQMPIKRIVERKKALYALGEKMFKKLLSYFYAARCISATEQSEMKREAEQWLSEHVCLGLAQLAIDGHDLLDLAVTDGVEVGELLNLLLDEVLENSLKNNAPALLARANVLIKKAKYSSEH